MITRPDPTSVHCPNQSQENQTSKQLSLHNDTTSKEKQARFVPRGINPSDNPVIIKNILVENKDKIVVNGSVVAPSNDVWKSIKKHYRIEKSEKALYTFVSCNKWNIKYDLGLLQRQCGGVSGSDHDVICGNEGGEEELEEVEEEEDEEREQEDGEEGSSFQKEKEFVCEGNSKGGDKEEGYTVDITDLVPSTSFNIFISREQWEVIEPEERIYHRSIGKEPKRFSRSRNYMVLKPGVWTDVINDLIWQSLKWPCSWSFKRNHMSISETARFWILIRAVCKCENHLIAFHTNPPPKNPKENGIFLTVKVWGSIDQHKTHCFDNTIRKRPYSGRKRKILGAEMLNKNLSSAKVRQEMASELMDSEGQYPAHLPSTDVGRQIRAEAQRSRRLLPNALQALQVLKHSSSPAYQFAIKEIGLDPFFIHLSTPLQLKVYNDYCANQYSKLIVDATGKLVKRLPLPGNDHSGHIFLYLGVVSICPGEDGIVPVVYMLSERHNANAITYWLSEWVRSGATKPKEIVIDDSAALISAVSRVFAEEPSTAKYIQKSFCYMLNGDERVKPRCLIRIDVAHFTKFVRRWPEMNSMRRKTKEFYIRAIILLAKAVSLQEVKEILRKIFIVGHSETEGFSQTSGSPVSCETAKQEIFHLISGIAAEECEVNFEDDDDAVTGSFETRSQFADVPEPSTEPSVKEWVKAIEEEVIENMIDDGDRDNIMHSPMIIKKLKHLCLILPLWCSVLPSKMESPFPRSVGAFVETQIGILKNTLLRKKNMRVDSFVKDLLDISDGALKLANYQSQNISNRRVEQQTNEETQEGYREGEEEEEEEEEEGRGGGGGGDEEVIDVRKEKDTHLQHQHTIHTSTAVNSLSCPACSNGDAPSGAHCCKFCKKPVHALDTCSVSFEGEEEGFGQSRVCFQCVNYMGSRPTGQKASNEKMESALTKYSRTSITDRQDIVIINDKNVELEAQSLEGWMGMSLPPKKRRVKGGYYWKACPDLQCLEDSKQIKIGVLKNGINPSLKTKRIGSKHITLSNTCGFDAPCQVLAIAYCDSVNYRNYVDRSHLENTIMEIAVELARKGTNHSLYMKRAVLLSKYFPHELLKGGVERVDCASSSSYMLRNVKLPPSMTEKYNCSSPHCPGGKEREIVVLSAMVDDKESTIERIEDALLSGETDDRTTCLLPMGDVSHVSPENFINDPEISKKGPVCSGIKMKHTRVGPHLVIEVVNKEERLHNAGVQIGVNEELKCFLKDIPRNLLFKNINFILRGAVGFIPPNRDTDVGHYRGYVLRGNGAWEMHDDLRDTVINIDGNVKINVHVLIYTI